MFTDCHQVARAAGIQPGSGVDARQVRIDDGDVPHTTPGETVGERGTDHATPGDQDVDSFHARPPAARLRDQPPPMSTPNAS